MLSFLILKGITFNNVHKLFPSAQHPETSTAFTKSWNICSVKRKIKRKREKGEREKGEREERGRGEREREGRWKEGKKENLKST